MLWLVSTISAIFGEEYDQIGLVLGCMVLFLSMGEGMPNIHDFLFDFFVWRGV